MVSGEHKRDRGRRLARRFLQLIGEEFREARLRAGLTQRQLGAAVGISHTEISRIELGKASRVPYETLVMLATVLGLDLPLRAYPSGEPIRDAAQVALLGRLRSRLPRNLRWRTGGAIADSGRPKGVGCRDRRPGMGASGRCRVAPPRCSSMRPANRIETARRQPRRRDPARRGHTPQPTGPPARVCGSRRDLSDPGCRCAQVACQGRAASGERNRSPLITTPVTCRADPWCARMRNRFCRRLDTA